MTLKEQRSAYVVQEIESGAKNVHATEIALAEGIHRVAVIAWATDTGEIIHLWVTEERRRQGLARQLFEAASAEGARHSAHRTREGDAWAAAVGGYLPRLIRI